MKYLFPGLPIIPVFKSSFRSLGKVFVFLFICLPVLLEASPWIDVGETRLRFNMQMLNDGGHTSIPTTTWPVMWADVKREVETVDVSSLTAIEKSALAEIKFEMRYQTKNEMRQSWKGAVSTDRALFRDFGGRELEQFESQMSFDWVGDRFSFKLQNNITSDPGEDSYDSQLYGSFVSGVYGDWVIGAGAFDQWWGPGWNTSLILSNNARPVPSVFFKTKSSQTFESSWLNWLGPWQFRTNIGKLESSRTIPDAVLWTMRFAFQPLQNLELGLSRAMQFGGQGRDEDLSTFFKVFLSKDENTEEGEGNQLGGFDVRYGFSWLENRTAAIYAQAIGEDEAGYLPSRRIYQFGLESQILNSETQSFHGFFEYINTTADGLFGGGKEGAAYGHGTYTSGYRYRGRVIGATYDGDAQVLTAGLNIIKTNGQTYQMVVSYAKLNEDGNAGSNTVSTGAVDIYQTTIRHQRIFLEGKLQLALTHLSDEIPTLQPDVDELSVSASWEYRF